MRPETHQLQANSDYSWAGVSQHFIAQLFPMICDLIKEACYRQHFISVDFLFYERQLREGRMQAWVLYDKDFVIRGVLLTTLYTLHDEFICDIPIASGVGIPPWEEFLTEVIEPWCRERNVTRLHFAVRPGIAKILKNHGYYKSDVIMTKHLRSGEN